MTASGADGAGSASGNTRRWWLNPALARLAFGESTHALQGYPENSLTTLQRLMRGGDAADLDLDDPTQREFGDYELIEQIGRGGMGSIYRARQRNLGREVAIKLLSAGQRASDELVDSLRREAQNAALLQHPNIVVVHEMGEHAGLIFYAMQLVRGRSLSQCLAADGPMAPRRAAELLRAVAEAVDYAHRLGVLHLDLKPGNILIDEQGVPLVADFGLARRLEQALDVAHISGTPSYMAPEQAQVAGHALSPATDVWALGAVLYELLTGQPPFDVGDPAATLELLRKGQVRRPSRIAAVPADLEAICLHCLAKDPAQRYSTTRALADDLGRYLDGRAVSVRPLNAMQRLARWARREPKLAITGGLATLALVVGLVATTEQWRRAEANEAISSSRLWESRREAALRLEQDGKGFDALPRLLQNISEEESAGQTRLAGIERRRVGMLLGQGAVLIDRMAVADANPLCVELSPDGSLLAIGFNDQSVRWYDTATLRERGRISLRGRGSSNGELRAPMLLRFADDHRLRATLEWYGNLTSPTDGDTWLIDLDHAAVVEPPAAFADFADAGYDADARHALLRNHRFASQLWQVAPWRAMSASFTPDERDFLPQMIGPDVRYLASLALSLRDLQLLDPRTGASTVVALPGKAGVSAWNGSRDGRWIALGDFVGHVFLVDTRTHAVRTLPTGRGREITWVSFSEDDAWLAAGAWDGIAYAFDVASGDALMSTPLHHDFVLRRVGISHERRLLLAAGDGEVALWRLPWQGPRGLPAQRIGLAPARHDLAGQYAVGWSLQAGLLATAGLDGQVRLWRLPLSTLQPARPAWQVPEKTWFDGRHLVDVQGDQLRIAAVDGSASTPWMHLPQAPGFAELVGGGRTLLVTLGPQLRVYDAATMQLRMTPVALPDSPQNLLASDDGTRVLLDFGTHDASGFEERLQLYDLHDGRRIGETRLRGPLRQRVFSPDGSRVLVVGSADGATSVLRSEDLRRIGEHPHDPSQPVLWADFAADGRTIVMVASAQDPRLGQDSLQWWDPGTDRTRVVGTGQVRPLGVIATPHGAFVAGMRGDLRDPGDGRLHPVPRLAGSEPTAVLAVSPDGRVVAHAFRHEVQLYDLATGAPVGPPLQLDTDAIDIVQQLAFAPDGRHLLAGTTFGYWQLWPIAAEPRAVVDLASELSRLSVARENQQRVHIPATAERLALRAGDPGRWPPIEPRPTVPIAAWTPTSHLPIPARAADTSPLLLDMTRFYTIAPEEVRNTYYSVEPGLRPVPLGLQRFDGVDYDIRGMIEPGGVIAGMSGGISTLSCLPVPAVPAAAFHPLMTSSIRSPMASGTKMAVLRLHYRDGSRAEVPLRIGAEVPGFAGSDQHVPTVFALSGGLIVLGYPHGLVHAPRLPNPHPERLVRCLDFEGVATPAPFLVYAITVEPVITRAISRTDTNERRALSDPARTQR